MPNPRPRAIAKARTRAQFLRRRMRASFGVWNDITNACKGKSVSALGQPHLSAGLRQRCHSARKSPSLALADGRSRDRAARGVARDQSHSGDDDE